MVMAASLSEQTAVVKGFSSRLQIDSVFICIGRCVCASKHLFAFHRSQNAGVRDRKHDDCDDHPKHGFHCTPIIEGLCRRRDDSYVTLAA
jgi:hypothetical protein